MEDAVEAFVKVRANALALARSEQSARRSPKRKTNASEVTDAPEAKRLRTSARLSRSRSDAHSMHSSLPTEQESDAAEADQSENGEDDYVPEAGTSPALLE
jgi:E3 ubiquitin-protein ligase RAD18